MTAELEQSVKAPVRAGDQVGQLSLVVRGRTSGAGGDKGGGRLPEATVGGYFLKMAALVRNSCKAAKNMNTKAKESFKGTGTAAPLKS